MDYEKLPSNKPEHETSARGKMDTLRRRSIGLEGAALIILRLAMGIDAIGVERGFEGPVLGQEIEVQVDVTCFPVGQAAHIPIAILAFAHGDDVFA